MIGPNIDVPQAGGTGPDINSVLARILNPVQGLINSPAPNVNVGSPLVEQDALKQAIARAMGVNPPPLRDDQHSSVLGRIGAMLMQPRQQGQSVAGNIGAAVNAGSQMSDAMRTQNQATSMKQAELGSTLATADVNRRTAEANLQILATKFPVEYAELQQRLRNATLQGSANEVAAIKAELMKADGAKRIVDAMNTEQRKADADVKNVDATARQHDAQSDYLRAQATILIPAHAEAYKGLNKPDQVTVIDKENGIVGVRNANGGVDIFQITPGVADAKQATERATKELKEEKVAEAKAKGRWFPGLTSDSPTPDEIKARAAKIMSGSVKQMTGDELGRGRGQQKPAAAPGPQSSATPQAAPSNAKYDKAMAKTDYDTHFAAAEQKYGIPQGVLKRLGATESQLNPKATNGKDPNGGSHGLMQVQKVHFSEGQDPYDPATNIDVAAKVFKGFLDKAGGDVAKAVEMYKGATSDKGRQSIGEARDFVAGVAATTKTGAPVVAQTTQRGDGTKENPIQLGGTPGNVSVAKGNPNIVPTKGGASETAAAAGGVPDPSMYPAGYAYTGPGGTAPSNAAVDFAKADEAKQLSAAKARQFMQDVRKMTPQQLLAAYGETWQQLPPAHQAAYLKAVKLLAPAVGVGR